MKNLQRNRFVLGITLLSFVSQMALGSLAQAHIWEIRQPTPAPLLNFNSASLLTPVRKYKDVSKELSDLIQAIPLTNASIQQVIPSKKKHAPSVVLIQDIHLNTEAQGNIAAVLQNLIDQKKVSLVGLEGCFEPLNFSPFRLLSDKKLLASVSRSYFEKGLLAAPSFVGLTSPTEPPAFIGIDDRAHYDANVKAYLSTRSLKSSVAKMLADQDRNLTRIKETTFTESLKRFDHLRTAFHKGQLELGTYLKDLMAFSDKEKNDLDFTIEQFLIAHEMEGILDFEKVDRERKLVLEQLSNRLTEAEVSQLLALSVDYRLGRIGFGDYHSFLKSLCSQKGISLERTPNFANYIRYVLLADGIKADQLFKAVEALESSVADKLIQTSEQRSTLEKSEQISLSHKLLDFSLSPDEWSGYKKGRHDDSLKSFESFYEEADVRSQKMAERLFSEKQSGNQVLVTGGFHTAELISLLQKKDYSVVVVSPKVTKVDSTQGTTYLSFFEREKSSLDRVFEGKKLFLTPLNNIDNTPLAARIMTGYHAREATESAANKIIAIPVQSIQEESDQPSDIKLNVAIGNDPTLDVITLAFQPSLFEKMTAWLNQNKYAVAYSVVALAFMIWGPGLIEHYGPSWMQREASGLRAAMLFPFSIFNLILKQPSKSSLDAGQQQVVQAVAQDYMRLPGYRSKKEMVQFGGREYKKLDAQGKLANQGVRIYVLDGFYERVVAECLRSSPAVNSPANDFIYVDPHARDIYIDRAQFLVLGGFDPKLRMKWATDVAALINNPPDETDVPAAVVSVRAAPRAAPKPAGRVAPPAEPDAPKTSGVNIAALQREFPDVIGAITTLQSWMTRFDLYSEELSALLMQMRAYKKQIEASDEFSAPSMIRVYVAVGKNELKLEAAMGVIIKVLKDPAAKYMDYPLGSKLILEDAAEFLETSKSMTKLEAHLRKSSTSTPPTGSPADTSELSAPMALQREFSDVVETAHALHAWASRYDIGYEKMRPLLIQMRAYKQLIDEPDEFNPPSVIRVFIAVGENVEKFDAAMAVITKVLQDPDAKYKEMPLGSKRILEDAAKLLEASQRIGKLEGRLKQSPTSAKAEQSKPNENLKVGPVPANAAAIHPVFPDLTSTRFTLQGWMVQFDISREVAWNLLHYMRPYQVEVAAMGFEGYKLNGPSMIRLFIQTGKDYEKFELALLKIKEVLKQPPQAYSDNKKGPNRVLEAAAEFLKTDKNLKRLKIHLQKPSAPSTAAAEDAVADDTAADKEDPVSYGSAQEIQKAYPDVVQKYNTIRGWMSRHAITRDQVAKLLFRMRAYQVEARAEGYDGHEINPQSMIRLFVRTGKNFKALDAELLKIKETLKSHPAQYSDKKKGPNDILDDAVPGERPVVQRVTTAVVVPAGMEEAAAIQKDFPDFVARFETVASWMKEFNLKGETLRAILTRSRKYNQEVKKIPAFADCKLNVPPFLRAYQAVGENMESFDYLLKVIQDVLVNHTGGYIKIEYAPNQIVDDAVGIFKIFRNFPLVQIQLTKIADRAAGVKADVTQVKIMRKNDAPALQQEFVDLVKRDKVLLGWAKSYGLSTGEMTALLNLWRTYISQLNQIPEFTLKDFRPHNIFIAYVMVGRDLKAVQDILNCAVEVLGTAPADGTKDPQKYLRYPYGSYLIIRDAAYYWIAYRGDLFNVKDQLRTQPRKYGANKLQFINPLPVAGSAQLITPVAVPAVVPAIPPPADVPGWQSAPQDAPRARVAIVTMAGLVDAMAEEYSQVGITKEIILDWMSQAGLTDTVMNQLLGFMKNLGTHSLPPDDRKEAFLAMVDAFYKLGGYDSLKLSPHGSGTNALELMVQLKDIALDAIATSPPTTLPALTLFKIGVTEWSVKSASIRQITQKIQELVKSRPLTPVGSVDSPSGAAPAAPVEEVVPSADMAQAQRIAESNSKVVKRAVTILKWSKESGLTLDELERMLPVMVYFYEKNPKLNPWFKDWAQKYKLVGKNTELFREIVDMVMGLNPDHLKKKQMIPMYLFTQAIKEWAKTGSKSAVQSRLEELVPPTLAGAAPIITMRPTPPSIPEPVITGISADMFHQSLIAPALRPGPSTPGTVVPILKPLLREEYQEFVQEKFTSDEVEALIQAINRRLERLTILQVPIAEITPKLLLVYFHFMQRAMAAEEEYERELIIDAIVFSYAVKRVPAEDITNLIDRVFKADRHFHPERNARLYFMREASDAYFRGRLGTAVNRWALIDSDLKRVASTRNGGIAMRMSGLGLTPVQHNLVLEAKRKFTHDTFQTNSREHPETGDVYKKLDPNGDLQKLGIKIVERIGFIETIRTFARRHLIDKVPDDLVSYPDVKNKTLDVDSEQLKFLLAQTPEFLEQWAAHEAFHFTHSWLDEADVQANVPLPIVSTEKPYTIMTPFLLGRNGAHYIYEKAKLLQSAAGSAGDLERREDARATQAAREALIFDGWLLKLVNWVENLTPSELPSSVKTTSPHPEHQYLLKQFKLLGLESTSIEYSPTYDPDLGYLLIVIPEGKAPFVIRIADNNKYWIKFPIPPFKDQSGSTRQPYLGTFVGSKTHSILWPGLPAPKTPPGHQDKSGESGDFGDAGDKDGEDSGQEGGAGWALWSPLGIHSFERIGIYEALLIDVGVAFALNGALQFGSLAAIGNSTLLVPFISVAMIVAFTTALFLYHFTLGVLKADGSGIHFMTHGFEAGALSAWRGTKKAAAGLLVIPFFTAGLFVDNGTLSLVFYVLGLWSSLAHSVVNPLNEEQFLREIKNLDVSHLTPAETKKKLMMIASNTRSSLGLRKFTNSANSEIQGMDVAGLDGQVSTIISGLERNGKINSHTANRVLIKFAGILGHILNSNEQNSFAGSLDTLARITRNNPDSTIVAPLLQSNEPKAAIKESKDVLASYLKEGGSNIYVLITPHIEVKAALESIWGPQVFVLLQENGGRFLDIVQQSQGKVSAEMVRQATVQCLFSSEMRPSPEFFEGLAADQIRLFVRDVLSGVVVGVGLGQLSDLDKVIKLIQSQA